MEMSSCDRAFYFFLGNLLHLELFSGIVHELIKFSRGKLTEILARQKTLEQAPVFQLMFQRVAFTSLCQLCVHHPCEPRVPDILFIRETRGGGGGGLE